LVCNGFYIEILLFYIVSRAEKIISEKVYTLLSLFNDSIRRRQEALSENRNQEYEK